MVYIIFKVYHAPIYPFLGIAENREEFLLVWNDQFQKTQFSYVHLKEETI